MSPVTAMQVFSDETVTLVNRSNGASSVGADQLDGVKTQPLSKLDRAQNNGPGNNPTDVPPAANSLLPDPEQVEAAVENINQALELSQRSVRLKASEYAQTAVVEVIDKETDQVIRQIPQESTLKLVEYWSQNGLLAEGALTSLSLDETA